ncbi:MAG: response regulator [Acidobacteriota bacterium]|nr:response regulator [Acidobacteriota bacterium]
MEIASQSKVLVIEDTQQAAAELQEELQALGHVVTGVATSTAEAVQSIQQNAPDLVLLGSSFQKRAAGLDLADFVRERFNIPVTLSVDAQQAALVPSEDGRIRVLGDSSRDPLQYAEVAGQSGLRGKERQKYFWLSTALNSAADGIIIVDAKGNVQFINPAAEHLTGCSQDEVAGKHFSGFLIFEHYGSRMADDLLRLATLNETPLSLGKDLVLVSCSGERRAVEAEISAAGENCGAFGSAVFTLRDVTQRRWEQHQDQQEFAIRAVERLAETTAHKLNNLLTRVLGNGELLLSGAGISGEHRESLKQVHDASLEIAAVVRQLSTIARKRFATRQELKVNEVIEGFLPYLAETLPPSIHLRTELDPSLPGVQADREQLEQILFNLVQNARDAISGNGGITISTTKHVVDPAERAKVARDYICMAVRDTGEGMDEQTVQKIFEPFFTTRNSAERSGLGLSITQGIVRDYNGFVEVKSEPGMGTEIRVGLPCTEPDPFAYLDQDADSIESGVKTVLVVEDDHAIRLLVRKILENNDYQVIEAQNGDDALMAAQLHDGRVDLLISDILMPGISGPDLVREFAQLHPESKFLLISGFDADKLSAFSSLPKGTDFLRKPFNQRDLLDRIEALIPASA